MCNAHVEGNYLRSSVVQFFPGKLVQQPVYSAKCDTAGSVHLIMQMILPALVFTTKPVTLEICVRSDWRNRS